MKYILSHLKGMNMERKQAEPPYLKEILGLV
jgi:hypothetical protein